MWNALEIFSTDIIMDYAIKNREEGKDFRHAFFAKEKEIFSLFGKDFEKRKIDEIDEILKKIHIMIFRHRYVSKNCV